MKKTRSNTTMIEQTHNQVPQEPTTDSTVAASLRTLTLCLDQLLNRESEEAITYDGDEPAAHFFSQLESQPNFHNLEPTRQARKALSSLRGEPRKIAQDLALLNKTYEEVKESLCAVYPRRPSFTLQEFYELKCTSMAEIETYYKNKVRIGLAINLPKSAIVQALSNGVPRNYGNLLKMAQTSGPEEWLRLAQQLTYEGDNTSTKAAQQRSPRQSRAPSITVDKTPPYPCCYCGGQHWHAQCQQRGPYQRTFRTFTPAVHSVEQPQGSTGPAGVYETTATTSSGETNIRLRELRSYERNYTISELECLAIVECVDKFRVYLLGTRFVIYSDDALQWLKTIKDPTGRLFRWSLRLSAYDYEVKYLKGSRQYEADLLSRNPFCGFLSTGQIKDHQGELRRDTRYILNDKDLMTITRRGVTKIIVPPSLRGTLLQRAHRDFNHPGISQMTRLIAAQYYWDGMTNDIRTHVRTCSVCQLVKPPKGPIYGELGQLPPVVLPYELVSLDTISGFAKYGNSQAFLHVVVDHATRKDAYGSQQNFRSGITLKKEELLECSSSNKGRATPCWINLKKKLQHTNARVKKCDLSKLAYELGEVVPPESRIVDLKHLILNSQSYEEEFAKQLLETLIEEREQTERAERERMEQTERAERERMEQTERAERERMEQTAERAERERKEQMEFELEKLRIQTMHGNSDPSRGTSNNAHCEIRKLMPKYESKDSDLSFYLILFERQAKRLGLDEDQWAFSLLGLLPYEMTQLIARETEEQSGDYRFVKRLLLKRYKLSPEQFRQKFEKHDKSQEGSWRDFASELRGFFNEWIEGMNVEDFDALKDLSVTNQLKKKVPNVLRNHLNDDWTKINNPDVLADKLDEYENVRAEMGPPHWNSKHTTPPSFQQKSARFPNRSEVKETEQGTNVSSREAARNEISEKYPNTSRRMVNRAIRNDKGEPKCFNCNQFGHIARDCPVPKATLTCRGCGQTGHKERNCTRPKEGLKVANLEVEGLKTVPPDVYLKDAKIDNKETVKAMIDTGSSSCLLRESVARRINVDIEPDSTSLYGIGNQTAPAARTVGKTTVDLEIDGVVGKEIAVFIVNDDAQPYDLLIGRTWTDLPYVSFARIGCTDVTKMDIKEVDGSKPVCLRPYKTTASEREAIREIVREWKDNGIVTETRSPYASPVLLVRKKTGDHRLVVDYRRLNIQTVKDKFPLPRIDDLLEGLRNAKFFTTLDLAHGYMQIPLTDKAKLKTAFITPDDTGQFERMIFGLANAPAEFQRLMHSVLGPLLNKKAFCYLDDVIIPAKDWREMIERLREVLERIRSAKLTLKPSKCEFGRREVEFLGYVISTGGLKPGPRKIKAIEEFPEPKNVHDIRRFLGLTNFFRRFVKDFARKAEPLSRLQKKVRTSSQTKNTPSDAAHDVPVTQSSIEDDWNTGMAELFNGVNLESFIREVELKARVGKWDPEVKALLMFEALSPEVRFSLEEMGIRNDSSFKSIASKLNILYPKKARGIRECLKLIEGLKQRVGESPMVFKERFLAIRDKVEYSFDDSLVFEIFLENVLDKYREAIVRSEAKSIDKAVSVMATEDSVEHRCSFMKGVCSVEGVEEINSIKSEMKMLSASVNRMKHENEQCITDLRVNIRSYGGDPYGNLPIVKVNINGNMWHLLYDTGSQVSIIDSEKCKVLKENWDDALKTLRIVSVTGQEQTLTRVKTCRVGNENGIELGEIRFWLMSLGDKAYDGILGINDIRRFNIPLPAIRERCNMISLKPEDRDYVDLSYVASVHRPMVSSSFEEKSVKRIENEAVKLPPTEFNRNCHLIPEVSTEEIW
ncbi:hypothetical protein LAZ67_3006014 [Cordylochernes scorpioides]|uniref:RNA-directed DNA polymerase n=1 Tax=Cordylochernes scorpioides TaxID=51811 RepID=A0ABY6KC63_9ARAC|nr:hypothetical protein LAZ67_3006014 [Cordylochernes scorpioides]